MNSYGAIELSFFIQQNFELVRIKISGPWEKRDFLFLQFLLTNWVNLQGRERHWWDWADGFYSLPQPELLSCTSGDGETDKK